MKPEPGKFYLATRAPGDHTPIGCEDGNDTPFKVTMNGGGLTVWGFSIWKNIADYRTYGIPLRELLEQHPGLIITEDRDRRLDKRTRTPKVAPVSLAKHRLQPVPEVLALLADLTKRAKAGEIRGIAVGVSCDQRADGSSFVIGDGTIASLYLGIERCKVRLLQEGE